MSPESQLYFLSDADTREILNWSDVIACLASAYRSPSTPEAAPPRAVARKDSMWLRAMAAIPSSGRYMGAKIIAKARARGPSYLIALWNEETAELVGLIDGKTITAMRTAGTSALAVDRIVPKDALHVAVLGTGAEAAAHVSAIGSVRHFQSLNVFSPTSTNRKNFAGRFAGELGVPCTAAETAEAAVSGADLVIAAARSRDETPVLQGAWLRPGMTVVSIGSTLPEQREVDPEVIRRAEVIIADVPEEVVNETGDMLAARRAGVEFEKKIVSLAEVVQGRRSARQGTDNIMLFKSVGSGLQDIAVSAMCFEKARQRGLGSPLAAGLSIKGREKKA